MTFRQLALDLAQHNAKNRPLAFHHLSQSVELTGMRITPSLSSKLLGFFGVGLLQHDPSGLGRFDHLIACDLQKPAVRGMGNGLFHHR